MSSAFAIAVILNSESGLILNLFLEEAKKRVVKNVPEKRG
jgi:hypothetical protein